MMLIAALMGMGLGMLNRQGNELERAGSLIRDVARMARNHARFYRAPARVVMAPPPGIAADGEERTLSVIALQPVCEWNFDDGRPHGTRGIGGKLGSAIIAPGGRIGQGLFPDAENQAPALHLDVRTMPAFDLRGGFVARCDVRLDQRSACTILRMGDAWELGIGAAGKVRGAVTFARDNGKPGRRVVLNSAARLPLRRWVRVALIVDRLRVVLTVNGREEASDKADTECYRDPRASFVVSDGGAPVLGVVDSVALFAFDVVTQESLPEFVDYVSGPETLGFDADGLVDRRMHPILPEYRLARNGAEEVIGFESGGLSR